MFIFNDNMDIIIERQTNNYTLIYFSMQHRGNVRALLDEYIMINFCYVQIALCYHLVEIYNSNQLIIKIIVTK